MGRIDGPGLRKWGGIAAMWLALSAAHGSAPFHAQIRLEPGQWEIRELDSGRTRPRAMCISDPAVLIQLEHGDAPCSHTVVSNTAQTLVVHYVCRMSGYGRTAVRMETTRLAKIDTQGIMGRAPFAYRAEARRTGACVRQETARR